MIHKHIRAIFDVPTLSKENHSYLRELLDTILKHLRALKALKRSTDAWDDLIIHIIVSKLDPTTGKAWETSIPDKDIPDLKSLIDFLSKRCQALETIAGKQPINQSNNSSKFSYKSKGTSVANLSTSNLACAQCKENHPLYFCKAFLKLLIQKRISLVKRAHLCINCLRSSSHTAKDCNSCVCRKCNKKHNTLLHLSNSVNKIKTAISDKLPSSSTKEAQSIVTQCTSFFGRHTFNSYCTRI